MKENNGYFAKVYSDAQTPGLISSDAVWIVNVGSDKLEGPQLMQASPDNIPTEPPTNMPTPKFADADVCSPFDFYRNPDVIEVSVPYEAEYTYWGPGPSDDGFNTFIGMGTGSIFYFYHKGGFWYVDSDFETSNGYEARVKSSVKSPAEIPSDLIWTYKRKGANAQ